MSKFYLCIDIINPNTHENETYYLVNEELEALLKYTTYCTSYNMLLSTLPNSNYARVEDFIRINAKKLNSDSFYYKKTKNSVPIKALYKEDEDILYTDAKSIMYLMLKNNIFITINEIYNNNFDPKIEEIYKMMASLITKKELLSKIDYNFKLRFDSDKNLEYVYLQNCKLWQKIASLKDNSDLVIKYICNDPYKKLLFASKLKEILSQRLISNERLEKNKIILRNKLKRKKMYYSDINRVIEKDFLTKYKKKASGTSTYSNYEDYDFFEDLSFELEDMLYGYEQKLIENPDDDDLRLYIDSQKEKLNNNGKSY